jgi:alcohol dehydrogenase
LGILSRDGAFSELFSMPLQNLRAVPDGVDDEAAVFVEPLAAACRILDQVHVRPTHRVTVLGMGRLGQLCARVLALTGAAVTGVSRSASKRELLPAGIETALPEEAAPGADIVVDCTGSAEGLATAQRLVRPQGTVVMKTTVHDIADANPTAWVVDELTIIGSRCGPFDAALRLLEAGAVDPTPLITARRSLSEGVDALKLAGTPGSIKVLLRP